MDAGSTGWARRDPGNGQVLELGSIVRERRVPRQMERFVRERERRNSRGGYFERLILPQHGGAVMRLSGKLRLLRVRARGPNPLSFAGRRSRSRGLNAGRAELPAAAKSSLFRFALRCTSVLGLSAGLRGAMARCGDGGRCSVPVRRHRIRVERRRARLRHRRSIRCQPHALRGWCAPGSGEHSSSFSSFGCALPPNLDHHWVRDLKTGSPCAMAVAGAMGKLVELAPPACP
jgi:hypothetical protein